MAVRHWLTATLAFALAVSTPGGAMQGRSMVPDQLAQSGWTVAAVRRIQAQLAQREDQLAQSEAGRRRAAREAQRGTASLIARLALRLGGEVRVGDEAALLRLIDDVVGQIGNLDADNQRLRTIFAGTDLAALVERSEAQVADGDLNGARATAQQIIQRAEQQAGQAADAVGAAANIDALRRDFGAAATGYRRAAELTPPGNAQGRLDYLVRALEIQDFASRLANDPALERAVIVAGDELLRQMWPNTMAARRSLNLAGMIVAQARIGQGGRGDAAILRAAIAQLEQMVTAGADDRQIWMRSMLLLGQAWAMSVEFGVPGAAAASVGNFDLLLSNVDAVTERDYWMAALIGRSRAENALHREQDHNLGGERALVARLSAALGALGTLDDTRWRPWLLIELSSHYIALADHGDRTVVPSAIAAVQEVIASDLFADDPASAAGMRVSLGILFFQQAMLGDPDANLHRSLQEFDQAATAFSLERDPLSHARLRLNRGRTLMFVAHRSGLAGDYDRAEAEFRAALQIAVRLESSLVPTIEAHLGRLGASRR